jgi:hypothetical protein
MFAIIAIFYPGAKKIRVTEGDVELWNGGPICGGSNKIYGNCIKIQ